MFVMAGDMLSTRFFNNQVGKGSREEVALFMSFIVLLTSAIVAGPNDCYFETVIEFSTGLSSSVKLSLIFCILEMKKSENLLARLILSSCDGSFPLPFLLKSDFVMLKMSA